MTSLCKSALLQGAVFSLPRNISRKEYNIYYETWIKPYLSIAYNHPNIPFFFYISGIVFEGFEKAYKECTLVLQELINRGQVELLGGLFYDSAPLLQTAKDQRDQIEKLSYYIKKHYKVLHKGLWVTPGTFDNTSIPIFKKTGAQYLFVQRAYVELVHKQFHMGLTEEKGETLPLFVYDKTCMQKLQATPTRSKCMKEIIENLNGKGERVHILLSEYHDTLDLKLYFKILEELQTLIEHTEVTSTCRLPSDERKLCKEEFTFCRIRTTAYGDEDNETFVKQLVYRNESRLLYGMLHYCAQKIAKYKKDKTRKQSAKLILMEAQNHFSFWSFTRPWGIQDIGIRQALYKLFVSILKTLQELETVKSKKNTLSHVDMNLDGRKEFLFASASLMAVVETQHGALCLLQRIGRSKSWNYGACYSRWYHAQYAPWSFREYVLPAEIELESLHMNMLDNKYVHSPVMFSKNHAKNTEGLLCFSTESHGINLEKTQKNEQVHAPHISFEKDYEFQNNAIAAHYKLTNISEVAQRIALVVELNLAFSHDAPEDLHIQTVENTTVASEHTHINTTQGLKFHHISQKEHLTIDLSMPAEVHLASVYGGEYLASHPSYQYTSLLVLLSLGSLAAQKQKDFALTISFASANK